MTVTAAAAARIPIAVVTVIVTVTVTLAVTLAVTAAQQRRDARHGVRQAGGGRWGNWLVCQVSGPIVCCPPGALGWGQLQQC